MPDDKWNPVSSRPAGLAFPSHLDPTGENGPTRVQARSPSWEKVAKAWYAPRDRPTCVEQRILDAACRLRHGDAVTAWAALKWRGGNFFDGLEPGGDYPLPVPLLVTSSLGSLAGVTVSKAQLAASEWEFVGGLPVATVQRALYDEVVRRGELWRGVEAVAMAAAARLISARLFATSVIHRTAWEGVPLVRKVAGLARDDLRSPREVWLHLVWELLAELPRVHANRAVFDLDGGLIGVPDLFDPESGTVGEYDGEHHKDVQRHRRDVEREDRFRDHGLEYFTAVRGDSRSEVAARIVRTRTRAKFLPTESRAWTLDPPDWYQAPEPVDSYLERTGLAKRLTHR